MESNNYIKKLKLKNIRKEFTTNLIRYTNVIIHEPEYAKKRSYTEHYNKEYNNLYKYDGITIDGNDEMIASILEYVNIRMKEIDKEK